MRYLPITKEDRKSMLQAIGCNNVNDLYKSVPDSILDNAEFNLPDHKGEIEVSKIISSYANQNIAADSSLFFLGAGTYYHHIPATVDYIIQRSEFLTSYTPYQPEISQGTLTYIFEFQTMIALLTGMDIANASMYDGATATAEAALMALRVNKNKNKINISGRVHPQYLEVLQAYLQNYNDIVITDAAPDQDSACVIVQTPDFYGTPQKLDELRKQCDATGALLVVVVNEIVSLGLLPAPVEADIVVGEAQSIGVAMSFGGPHLGFFACREKYLRQMPGRLCGQTVDADGKRSFVLTLSTREQHIRREKATSNICTNQGLCALAFTVHMALLGEDGFKKLARINHERACLLAERLAKISGVKVVNDSFFNEFVIELNKDAKSVIANLAKQKIIAGYAVAQNKLLVAATEMTEKHDIELFAKALESELK